MRMLERAQDLDRIGDGLLDRQRTLALHIGLERDAVDVLHDDILVFALDRNVKDLDDIGVRKHQDRLGLIDKTLNRNLIGGKFILEDLHSNRDLAEGVIRLEHHCHAADADQSLDLIASVQEQSDIIVILIHIYLRLF